MQYNYSYQAALAASGRQKA